MAFNELQVIAFRILAYLKHMQEENKDISSNYLYNPDNFLTNKKQYFNTIYELYQSGYIDGVREEKSMGAEYHQMIIDNDIRITLDGIKYFKYDSLMEETRDFLRRNRDPIAEW